MTVVLDASALLAISFDEPGAERVMQALDDAIICAVNATEVISKYVDKGMNSTEACEIFGKFELFVSPFTTERAELAAALREETRSKGLSLGDRACLALAKAEGATVLTADRAWAELQIEIDIEVIR